MSRFISAAIVGAALLVSGNAFAAKYNAAAGKATYDASCAMCHKTGMMGAPKVGDKAAWKQHLAKGMNAMVINSIKGYKGAKGMMPAKGGNPKLTDEQVGNAVAFMVEHSK